LQRRAIGLDCFFKPRRSLLPLSEHQKRITKIVLHHCPSAWLALRQSKESLITIDHGGQSGVVAEFVPLPKERLCLLLEIFDPPVLNGAARRNCRCRPGEMSGCFAILQPS
jgi:hypothetical protein